MKAWLLDDFTGIDHLRLAEVADPKPKAGEAILEVKYAALNPADRYLAERQYPARPALPHILGRDGIGRVVEVGAGAEGIESGQTRAVLRGEVGINRPGTFAERVAVPVDDLVEVPSEWDETEGAGATLVYLTAWQALTMWGGLPSEAVVLVTGASGGVGVAAIQLAVAMRYRVIALSRGEAKRERLLQLGASDVFDPEDPQLRQEIRKRLGTKRVDLVLDNVGGRLLPQVIDTLGELGRVSLIGRLAGPVPEFNTAALFFRRIRMGGVAVGAYTNAEARGVWNQALHLLGRTGARPLVDSVFSFEQLPQAFERLRKGPMGKVLIRVGNP
jgi:NADPH:quinone reductase